MWRLPSSGRAIRGRNGSSQAKIPSCSRVTPSRSAYNTRMVLSSLPDG